MRARILVVVAAPLLALGACQLFVSFDDPGSPAVPDAGNEAGFDAKQGDAGDPCQHRVPPPRPTAASDGGLDESTFLNFAMKTVRFLPPSGWDLDGYCTGDTRSTTSQQPCTPVEGGAVLPDLDGGVDDSFGVAASGFTFGNVDPVASAANIRIGEGNTLLFTLTGYNGGSDDDHVQFAVGITHNVQKVIFDGGKGELDASTIDGGALFPQWNGNDTWGVPSQVATTPTAGGGLVLAELWDGYVANKMLVVRPPTSLVVPLGVDSELHDVILTATIEQSDGLMRLRDGIIAGRVSPSDIVRAAGHFSIFNGGQEVVMCAPANRATYLLIRKGICLAPDVPLERAMDGMQQTCDALSVTLGFDAWPAHVGVHGIDVLPEVCAPGSLLLSCATDMDGGSDGSADADVDADAN